MPKGNPQFGDRLVQQGALVRHEQILSEVTEWALTIELGQDCPRCSGRVFGDGEGLFCMPCGWRQDSEPVSYGLRGGSLSLDYCGEVKTYKLRPLRIDTTRRAKGLKVKLTPICPVLDSLFGEVKPCGREMVKQPQNKALEVPWQCYRGHRIIVTDEAVWRLSGERARI